MKAISLWVAVFGGFGILGPCINLMVLLTIRPEPSSRLFDFFYNLVFLLWPTWYLAVAETIVGRFKAGALAIGSNVMAFVILGLVTWVVFKFIGRGIAVYITCVLVWISVTVLALWWNGFNPSYMNSYALAVALILYAIPFYLCGRHYQRLVSQ